MPIIGGRKRDEVEEPISRKLIIISEKKNIIEGSSYIITILLWTVWSDKIALAERLEGRWYSEPSEGSGTLRIMLDLQVRMLDPIFITKSVLLLFYCFIASCMS